jgi:hypothetical protein
MICLRCRRRIRRDWTRSWWACACRVWATDEHLARGDS